MKILITGAWKYSTSDISHLESLGFDCYFQKDEMLPLSSEMFDVEFIICNSLFLYNDARLFKKLKFVQLTSAGLDRVPVEYFKNNGVIVFNAAGVYSVPIAEFVISSVLDIYKKKIAFYNNQKKHNWDKQRDVRELNGKVVCIVGCGNIGKECARLFKAFNCRVLGVDVVLSNNGFFDEMFMIGDIKKPFDCSDVVVLTLPLTPATKNLFNASLFGLMHNKPIFINVSRGEIVNINDLICALDSDVIASAVLDVFEEEPLDPRSPLWRMKNVFISPHNSFIGDGNNERLSKLIFSNLKEFVA